MFPLPHDYRDLLRGRTLLSGVLASLALALFGAGAVSGGEPQTKGLHGARVSPAEVTPQGWRVHRVESPFQTGATKIKVLLPERLEPGKRYPVLYVLPVEAGEGTRWGDPLAEINKHDLNNQHGLICVVPTFSHLPWYADHPSDPHIRQESYFVEVVVPFVESAYPARRDAEGRLLVGFSKSGWGAFCLLLRHPDLFGRAAAWDAPLEEDRPERFGMGPIFGTQENFERYQITRLLDKRAKKLGDGTRLVLTGYDTFRKHHRSVHRRMVALGIAHEYRDGPQRKHSWHSGWLPEAVELLMAPGPVREE